MKIIILGLVLGTALLFGASVVSATPIPKVSSSVVQAHYHRHVTARGVARRTTRRVVRRHYY